MKHRIITMLLLMCLPLISAMAQMTFTLNGLTYGDVAEKDSKGFTTVTLPAGTDLSGLITAVSIDGQPVDASKVTPNPTTTKINYGELKVFTYNNKAYGFRFEEDVWFCAVFFSDCHINQGSGHDGTSAEDMTNISKNIIAMGRTAYTTTPKVQFSGIEGLPNKFIPKANIVFSLGDCDADKDNHEAFLASTSTLFKDANIPFIFIAGNHDFSPDYWTGSDPDYGVTSGTSGGAAADKQTLNVIKTNNSYWNGLGVFDSDGALEYITDDNYKNYDFQPWHFTFKFGGVRFYCANNYWFQKSYDGSFTKVFGSIMSKATYYSPDGTINALDNFVENHASEASVWMQHYPFNAGSDVKRWWLDQCDASNNTYIKTANSSIYGTDKDIELWSNTGGTATEYANKKRDALATIIEKTANPVHFSGHTHFFADMTWTNNNHSTHDYTVAANGKAGENDNAYVVLIKKGEGVKAVVRTQF